MSGIDYEKLAKVMIKAMQEATFVTDSYLDGDLVTSKVSNKSELMSARREL